MQSARQDIYGELLGIVGSMAPLESLRMLRVVPAACFDVHARRNNEGIFDLMGMLLGNPSCFPLEELILPLPLSLAHTEQVGGFLSRVLEWVSYEQMITEQTVAAQAFWVGNLKSGLSSILDELTLDGGLRHMHTLDVSLPSATPPKHAGPNTWDVDVASLLLQLPSLAHFAARNTPAGTLMRAIAPA